VLIDANARIDRRIDADDPTFLVLADDHIGHDGAWLKRAEFGTGTRIQSAYEFECFPQLAVRTPEKRAQRCMIARCHHRKLVVRDLDRERVPRQ